MKQFERCIAMLLVTVMLCGMVPTHALAEAMAEPVVEETAAPVEVVEEEPTQEPTGAPTEAPTQTPTEEPTEAPTEEPTQAPTEEPTQAPTEEPTQAPTEAPTQTPTEAPTQAPTEEPTQAPTEAPTEEPTEAPTEEPTEAPTEEPTEEPTEAPTEEPTQAPTEEPTEEPTQTPTEEPTQTPTEEPTQAPTEAPTEEPTEAPTEEPTEAPTEEPTEAPTEEPTEEPTQEPTEEVAATFMLRSVATELKKVEFTSYPRGVLAGETYSIYWDASVSDTYIVNVKLLDGAPAYNDNEDGKSIVLNKRVSTTNYIEFTVPSNASDGQYIKVHAYGESDGVQTEVGNQIYIRVGCLHGHRTFRYPEEYFPIEGDEEYHEYVKREESWCADCNILVYDSELSTEIQGHEYLSDGRCSLCRYKKEIDCYHTNSNRMLYSTGYQKKDEEQHYIVHSYRVTCKDCGILIYSSMPEYQPEAHVFGGTSTCTVCGWSAGDGCLHLNEECTQPGKSEYSHEYLYEYEPFYHIVYTECVLSCKDCGEVLAKDWTMSDWEPHEFDSNNQCNQCGYVGEALANDTIAPEIISFSSSVGTTVTVGQMPTYEAVVYDENLRYVGLFEGGWTLDEVVDPVSSTADVSAWSYAGEPGTYVFKVLAVDYAGNSTVKELVITIVSEETDCQHTNYTDYYNETYPIKYTEKDETWHYYQVGYDRECDNCSESWVIYSDPPLTEKHTYENGVCKDCGYIAEEDETDVALQIDYTYMANYAVNLDLYVTQGNSEIVGYGLRDKIQGTEEWDDYYQVSDFPSNMSVNINVFLVPGKTKLVEFYVMTKSGKEVVKQITFTAPALNQVLSVDSSFEVGEPTLINGSITNISECGETIYEYGFEFSDGHREVISSKDLMLYKTDPKIEFSMSKDMEPGEKLKFRAYTECSGGYAYSEWKEIDNTPIDEKSPVIETIQVSPKGIAFPYSTELTFSTIAADETALASIIMYIDDAEVAKVNVSGLSDAISYATGDLAIGEHAVRVVATDAAGWMNEVSLTVTITAADPSTCRHLHAADKEKTRYFEQPDEKNHQLVIVMQNFCSDCATFIGEEVVEKNSPELHKWENGRCGVCEHACAHASATPTYARDIPVIFENITETTHDVRNGYRMICDECGQATGETGYFAAETEQHDYTNGDVCVCKYDRTNCQHVPDPDPNKTNYKAHIFEEIAGDNVNHLVAGVIYSRVCLLCESDYEEEVRTGVDGDTGKEFPYTQEHAAWKDGVCQTCTYACVHEFQDIMLPDGNHKAENGVWESKGESGHWCTSIEWWEKCVNCGLEQKYTKIDPYKGEPQAHMMNNTLKTYYAYNDNEHWQIGEDKRCTAKGCDYQDYVDAVNVAREKHNLKLINTELQYSSVGGGHNVFEIEYYACDCGFDSEVLGNSLGLSGHVDYDNNGTCDGCGESLDANNTYNDHYSQHHFTDIGTDQYTLIEEKARQLFRLYTDKVDDYVDLFVKYVEEAPYKERLILINSLDRIFRMTMSGNVAGNGSYYATFGNELLLDTDNFKEETPDYYVMFHELGHAVDDLAIEGYLGLVSSTYRDKEGKSLNEVIIEDIIVHIKENIGEERYSSKEWERVIDFIIDDTNRRDGRLKILNMDATNINDAFPVYFTMNEVILAKEIIEFYSGPITFSNEGVEFKGRSEGFLSQNIALSDKFGGATGNLLYGGIGHPDGNIIGEEDYWHTLDKLNGQLAQELWADYFSYSFTNDIIGLNYLEENLPNAYKMLEEIKNHIYTEITKE